VELRRTILLAMFYPASENHVIQSHVKVYLLWS